LFVFLALTEGPCKLVRKLQGHKDAYKLGQVIVIFTYAELVLRELNGWCNA